MSTQIAVRLPDDTVSQMDALVAAGDVANRTELVSVAIQRELRRRAAERDASVLRAKGADDDLDGLVDWATGHFQIERD
ncbi:ribbon-helix-helix domain-containing protein [Microbacterium sp. A82]|uniref:ribbon-helix-helix domain-containing protein n=1 Tax=unclassified Microbacterium TaxID=2609290 RepID=UPI003F3C8176